MTSFLSKTQRVGIITILACILSPFVQAEDLAKSDVPFSGMIDFQQTTLDEYMYDNFGNQEKLYACYNNFLRQDKSLAELSDAWREELVVSADHKLNFTIPCGETLILMKFYGVPVVEKTASQKLGAKQNLAWNLFKQTFWVSDALASDPAYYGIGTGMDATTAANNGAAANQAKIVITYGMVSSVAKLVTKIFGSGNNDGYDDSYYDEDGGEGDSDGNNSDGNNSDGNNSGDGDAVCDGWDV